MIDFIAGYPRNFHGSCSLLLNYFFGSLKIIALYFISTDVFAASTPSCSDYGYENCGGSSGIPEIFVYIFGVILLYVMIFTQAGKIYAAILIGTLITLFIGWEIHEAYGKIHAIVFIVVAYYLADKLFFKSKEGDD